MKSRKSTKRIVRNSRKPIAVKEAGQRVQSVPLPPKQAAAARSAITPAEQPVRYPYALSELRRTAVIAGGILVLLVVLYFLLR